MSETKKRLTKAERLYEDNARRIVLAAVLPVLRKELKSWCDVGSKDFEERQRFSFTSYIHDYMSSQASHRADTPLFRDVRLLVDDVHKWIRDNAMNISVRSCRLAEKRIGIPALVDAKCRMPRMRKERGVDPKPAPMTAVQKRAADAAAKLVAWERRHKASKTKVAKLKKKVAYYKKKGLL